MKSREPEFPFFIPVAPRGLTTEERETICKLLERANTEFSEQIAKLKVVGRCGCGKCPTIFFEPYDPGEQEEDLSAYAGTDQEGGLVGAVLMQKQGRLSQLEFYSVDGHEPWSLPRAESLKPYT